jgi:hypothetical protein
MKPRKDSAAKGAGSGCMARLVRLWDSLMADRPDRGGIANLALQSFTGLAVVRVKDLRLVMGNHCSCRAKMEGWTDSANRASAIQSLIYAHTVCGYLLRPSETADLQLESRLHASAETVANMRRPDMDTQTPTNPRETRNPADMRCDRAQTGSEFGAVHTLAQPSASDRGSESSPRLSPGETRKMDSSFLPNADVLAPAGEKTPPKPQND